MMTKAQLLRFFKSSHCLMISEHKGALWATDSFLLVKLGDSGTSTNFRDLLADYNLQAEPMVCGVYGTIARAQRTPPNIEALLTSTAKLRPVKPFTVQGTPMFTSYGNMVCAVWRTFDGHLVTLDKTRISVVEAFHPKGEWKSSDAQRLPVARFVGRERVALLMPVANRFEGIVEETA